MRSKITMIFLLALQVRLNNPRFFTGTHVNRFIDISRGVKYLRDTRRNERHMERGTKFVATLRRFVCVLRIRLIVELFPKNCIACQPKTFRTQNAKMLAPFDLCSVYIFNSFCIVGTAATLLFHLCNGGDDRKLNNFGAPTSVI